MLRGAAARGLLHSPDSKPSLQEGHCQKSCRLSQVWGHTTLRPLALQPGDNVLPCHPGWGRRSGSGAIVWTHDTFTHPSSPSCAPQPSLAGGTSLGSAAFPGCPEHQGGLCPPPTTPCPPKPSPLPAFPPSATGAVPSLPTPSPPLLYPTCSGLPQTMTALRDQASADLVRIHPPKSPWRKERGTINDHK